MFTRKFLRFFKREKKQAIDRYQSENEVLLKSGQEQLKELAKKGLSIPVFTL